VKNRAQHDIPAVAVFLRDVGVVDQQRAWWRTAWQIVVRRMRRKMRDLERQQAIETRAARIAQTSMTIWGADWTQTCC